MNCDQAFERILESSLDDDERVRLWFFWLDRHIVSIVVQLSHSPPTTECQQRRCGFTAGLRRETPGIQESYTSVENTKR
jgi:hypothetical protein